MRQKRRYARTNIQSIATLTLIKKGTASRSFEGLIWSVGFGGLGIRARDPVSVGSQIKTVLKLVDRTGKVRRETVTGSVVWEADQSPYFMFGIQFVSLNSKDHPGLMSFLEGQKQEFERLHLQDTNLQPLSSR